VQEVRKRPRRSIAPLLAVVGTALGCSLGGTPDPRPNVVLIIIDTLRADRLASYGYAQPTSPELDALAAQGVRFARAIAQSSWTRPSIGSILTSQYPRSLGVYREREHRLPASFPSLAEILDSAGYTTLGATANPNVNTSFGFERGFDHYIDSDVLFQFMPEAIGDNSIANRPLQSAGEIFASLLEEIDDRDGPFYVQANIMEVHQSDELADNEFSGRFARTADREYAEAVRLASSEVGRFVATLRDRDDFENTLFAIVSDHGHGLADHPSIASRARRSRQAAQGHGWLLYESQLLVPMILYDTRDRLPRGRVIERTVRLLDLMPTLLDLAGVRAPPGLEGLSLLGLWDDTVDAPELPRHFVVETQFRGGDKIGVYGPKWKYFEYRKPIPGKAPQELQARGGDEDGIQSNQIERHPGVAANLARVLADWEASHPRARPTLRHEPLPESEVRQLKSLGYLE
jgi:arylsulfatase A-like enzyme